MKKIAFFLVCIISSVAALSQFCRDTSFRKLYSVTGGNLKNYQYFSDPRDSTFISGSLIAGSDTAHYFAAVNSNGNVDWARKLKFNNQLSYTNSAGIASFGDNSLLVLFAQPGDSTLRLLKFDISGNLLYSKIIKGFDKEVFYESKLKIINDNIYILTAAIPQSGSQTDKHYNSVIKIAANGTLLWAKYYGENYDCVYSTPTNILQSGLDLIVIGRTLPSECNSQPPAGLDRSIYTMRLNPANGNLIGSSNYTTIKEFNINASTIGLTVYNDLNEVNSKIFFTGSLSSLYSGKVGGYKFELNNNLEFLNGKLYYYNGSNPSGFTRVSVNRNEQVDVLLADRATLNARSIYFGKFDSLDNIIRQKKTESIAGTNFSFMGKSPFISKLNYLNVFSTFNNAGTDCLQLTQLSNDELNDDCYGKDTSFIKTMPFSITDYQSPFFDQAGSINLNISDIVVSNQPLSISRQDFCQQISVCNSLILHKQPDTICNLNNEYTFYAQVNTDCKKHLSWSIDTAAISYLTIINDTTIKVKFKQNWSGYLYTAVSSCSLLKDSLLLTVHETPGGIALGNDTVLCSGQTLTLQPKTGFLNYRWENNSTVRERTISAAGTYSIISEDYCHTLFYDTIVVRFYNTIVPGTLGSDTSLCAGETLLLNAGLGYRNYLWQDGSTNHGLTVTSAGIYFVKATDSCGNIFKDTINVTYYISRPPVNLGSDKTLCNAQSLILNAGSGYKNYTWQDGSTFPTMSVFQSGIYSVTVTDSCGNLSQDQLEIFPVENFSLNISYDKPVCNNDTAHIYLPLGLRNYTLSPSADSYVDNNNLILFPQSNTIYSLQAITPGGCILSNTFQIKTIDCGDEIYFPAAFTPNGDGVNDVFRGKAFAEIISFQLSIFNRYGQLIFLSNDLKKGWDGKIAGKSQNNGTYVWQCRYQLRNKIAELKKGSFLLLH